MKSLRLVLEHTDETIHPMHAFVCQSPAVEREVLLEGKTDEGVRTLLFYVEGDRDAYEETLAARPDVEEYDVTPASDDGFYLYARAANREQEDLLLGAFQRETVVVPPPVEFRADRTMHLTVIGHPDDLQGVLDGLPEPIGVDVLRIGEYTGGVGTGLSERQRDALAAAWAAGYYEIPRDAGIETVAAELDCAVSTASDLLRRAESTLVAAALDERR